MGKTTSPQALAKFIAYILERRPDEFGLVTDAHGFVKIKELLKAIAEEKGWKYVRRSHLDEVLYSLPSPPFEVIDRHIRAKRRDHLPQPRPLRDPPKLLFTSIRKRAYPSVSEKGIFPAGYPQVVLTSDRDMAERIGRRSDPEPVILTVQVQKSIDNGVMFNQAGHSLFTAESIPAGCFSGPPLPKEKPEAKKPEKTVAAMHPKTAGGFLVDFNMDNRHRSTGGNLQRKKRGKKDKLKRKRPPWRR